MAPLQVFADQFHIINVIMTCICRLLRYLALGVVAADVTNACPMLLANINRSELNRHAHWGQFEQCLPLLPAAVVEEALGAQLAQGRL